MGGTVTNVPLRRWEDWERSRLRKMKRDERRRREFERQFGSRQTYQSGTTSMWDDSNMPGSETASSYGGEEDRWGLEIGGYAEDGPTLAPPPVGLFLVDEREGSSEGDHETIEGHELELVLDQGWEEDSPQLGGRPFGAGAGGGYNSRPTSPPSPPKLYSLSDAPVMHKTWSSNSHDPLAASSASSSVEHFSPNPLNDPFNSSTHYAGYAPASPLASPHAQMLPPGAGAGFGSGASSSVDGGYGHVKNRSLSSSSSSPVMVRGGAGGGGETPSPTREGGRRLA